MEMLVEWEGPGATLRTGIDPDRKLVRIAPGSNWTLADVDRFEVLQTLINDTARARYGVLGIVMDLRAAHVVTAEVSAKLSACSPRIYGAADYVAVITQSALLKMQMRRAFTVGIVEIFTSEAAAEAWLAEVAHPAESLAAAAQVSDTAPPRALAP